jgi:hypothetical protein
MFPVRINSFAQTIKVVSLFWLVNKIWQIHVCMLRNKRGIAQNRQRVAQNRRGFPEQARGSRTGEWFLNRQRAVHNRQGVPEQVRGPEQSRGSRTG